MKNKPYKTIERGSDEWNYIMANYPQVSQKLSDLDKSNQPSSLCPGAIVVEVKDLNDTSWKSALLEYLGIRKSQKGCPYCLAIQMCRACFSRLVNKMKAPSPRFPL
jgi:hypothetical protein